MTPDRSNRTVVATLVLAPLLAGMLGFGAGFPGPAAGSAGRAGDQATALPPPSGPEPTLVSPMAEPDCRLVAGPASLGSGPGGELELRASLTQAGLGPLTVAAIEGAWEGPARLSSVEIGELRIAVKEGASPVFVPLTAGARLEPGKALELRLGFSYPEAPAGWSPGPFLVHLREGCEVAVAPALPSACGLVLNGPEPVAGVPEQVTFYLSNDGDEAIEPALLELFWPLASNGALRGFALGAEAIRPIDPPLGRSPALLNLRPSGTAPITIPVGTKLPLTLAFEAPAVAEPYTLHAATASGCRAGATTWPGDPDCGLVMRGGEPQAHAFSVEIENRHAISQTLGALDVFWSPALNGALTQVLVDGRVAWEGRAEHSPASLSEFRRPLRLPPEGATTLLLRFEPGAEMQVGDQAPEPAAGEGTLGDLSLVARFEGGCQASYSSLRQAALGCRVWASDLLPDGGPADAALVAKLTNTAGQAVLSSATIQWPARNGALTGVFLDETPLIVEPVAPERSPYLLNLESAGLTLPRGGTRALRLTFAEPPAAYGTRLLLGLKDLDGNPCGELNLAAPRFEPDCDLVGFDQTLEFEGRHVSLWLRNDNPAPLTIDEVTVEWPDLLGTTLMRVVSIILDDGNGERPIWTGTALKPPVTVRPDPAMSPPVVEPGQAMRLRITFDPAPDPGSEFRDAFKVRLGFVEGCASSFPSDGGRISSRTTEIHGVIQELPRPDTVFGCCWKIVDQHGRLVLVDVPSGSTHFVPASARPKRGDFVTVRALVSPEGRLSAKLITIHSRVPEETLIGAVLAMDPPDPAPGTAPERLVVGTERVTITSRTRIEGAQHLRLGAQVRVRGWRLQAEALEATRIEVLDQAGTGTPVTLQGAVREVMDGELPGIEAVWVVDHYRVEIPIGVSIEGLPPSGRPGLGWEARIEGLQAGGLVRAEGGRVLPPPQLTELDGTVAALPPGGVVGDWTVSTAGGDLVVNVPSAARVNTRSAPVAPGMAVHLVLRTAEDGTPEATSVVMDWP